MSQLSAIEEMTKTFIPTGGVMSPTSTTTSASIPNQIFRSPVVMPKPAVSAAICTPPLSSTSTGQKKGIISRIIERLSSRQPSKIIPKSSTISTDIGSKPATNIQSARACGRPVRLM